MINTEKTKRGANGYIKGINSKTEAEKIKITETNEFYKGKTVYLLKGTIKIEDNINIKNLVGNNGILNIASIAKNVGIEVIDRETVGAIYYKKEDDLQPYKCDITIKFIEI